jgi:hypothetical protein
VIDILLSFTLILQGFVIGLNLNRGDYEAMLFSVAAMFGVGIVLFVRTTK